MSVTFAAATYSGHKWTVRTEQRAESHVRLFCIPYAGGGPSSLRPWSRGFGRSIEVSWLALPGRERSWKIPACRRVSEIVQGAAPAALELTDRPYAIFGHSMGALLGFELARELRRLGAPSPRHVFASAYRAPHLPARLSSISALEDATFLNEIRRRYDGIPAEVMREPELLALVLPRLRADFEALETYEYRPGEPLDCPVTAFGGCDDATLNRDELEGWGRHTSMRFELKMWPGGHMFLHAVPREMTAAIAAALDGEPVDISRMR